jgi:LuxR family transcriptional regulator, maltose regulon positive regulatory protein
MPLSFFHLYTYSNRNDIICTINAYKVILKDGLTKMARTKKINKNIHYFSSNLKDKLDEIKNIPTTIIEAPSGYGKTTTVRAFFSNFFKDTIYLSWFIAAQESGEKGWERFCKEIEKFNKIAGRQLLNLGFPDEDTVGEVSQIVRTLVCDEEVYLIVDNFHLLQEKIPQGIWLSLIEHEDPNLHFIILTQLFANKGPTIVGNSNVLFINTNDLRLSKQDIQKYYQLAGIEISEEQANKLDSLTSGWIVALYLQLINYLEMGFFSYTNHISNLIEDVFWAKLNSIERDLLLSLSQFKSFTIRQANYMLGIEKVPNIAKNLVENNAFIQYDDLNHQYNFHTILLEFLKIKFEEKDEAYQLSVLNKSGEWCKSIGENLMAFKLFYSLKDYEKILSLNISDIELSQTDETGFYETIIDIINKCPYETKCKYPITFIQIALELFGAGFYEEFGGLCYEIEIMIDNAQLSQIEKNKLYGELSLLNSFSQFNDIEKMCLADKKAYELLSGCTSTISITEPWTFGSPSVLYMFHRESGSLAKEVDCMQESLPYYSKLTKGHGTGADIVMKAEMLLYQGDLEEAELLSHKAVYIAKSNDQDSIFLCSLMVLARIHILNEDFNGFDGCIKQLEEYLKNSSKKSNRMTVDIIKAFLSNALGKPDAVPEWIKSGDINQKRLFDVAIPFAQMVYFKNRLLQKEYKWIIALSDEFINTCKILHFLLPQIYIKIYTAVAYYSLGNTEKAINLLKSAYSLAIPDKLYLPFAENSELIGPLLSEAFIGQSSKDLTAIHTLSLQYCKGKAIIHDKFYKEELPLGLTEREFQIAKLASVGFQNKEIAETLFLSENTVKQYLKNIFIKLNIKKRSSLKHIIP